MGILVGKAGRHVLRAVAMLACGWAGAAQAQMLDSYWKVVDVYSRDAEVMDLGDARFHIDFANVKHKSHDWRLPAMIGSLENVSDEPGCFYLYVTFKDPSYGTELFSYGNRRVFFLKPGQRVERAAAIWQAGNNVDAARFGFGKVRVHVEGPLSVKKKTCGPDPSPPSGF